MLRTRLSARRKPRFNKRAGPARTSEPRRSEAMNGCEPGVARGSWNSTPRPSTGSIRPSCRAQSRRHPTVWRAARLRFHAAVPDVVHRAARARGGERRDLRAHERAVLARRARPEPTPRPERLATIRTDVAPGRWLRIGGAARHRASHESTGARVLPPDASRRALTAARRGPAVGTHRGFDERRSTRSRAIVHICDSRSMHPPSSERRRSERPTMPPSPPACR